jgi:hypothetical protein
MEPGPGRQAEGGFEPVISVKGRRLHSSGLLSLACGLLVFSWMGNIGSSQQRILPAGLFRREAIAR